MPVAIHDHDLNLLDVRPNRFLVRDTASADSVTRTYSVIVDYGWAELILCSGCHRKHADVIAAVLAEHVGCEVGT